MEQKLFLDLEREIKKRTRQGKIVQGCKEFEFRSLDLLPAIKGDERRDLELQSKSLRYRELGKW